MRATTVVEVEIAGQCLPGDGYSLVTVQIHFLVLHGFPEPLDEDVLASAPLPSMLIGAPFFSNTSMNAELAALIGIHDLRPTVPHGRFFQRIGARVGG